jgi:hypothetical protein
MLDLSDPSPKAASASEATVLHSRITIVVAGIIEIGVNVDRPRWTPQVGKQTEAERVPVMDEPACMISGYEEHSEKPIKTLSSEEIEHHKRPSHASDFSICPI